MNPIFSFDFPIGKNQNLVIDVEPSNNWLEMKEKWKGHKTRKKQLESIFEVKTSGQVIAMFGLEKKGFKHAGLSDAFKEWNIISYTGFTFFDQTLLQDTSTDKFRSSVLEHAVEYLRRSGYKKERVDVVTELTLLGVTVDFKRRVSAVNKLPGWFCLGVGYYHPGTYSLIQRLLQKDPELNIADIDNQKGVTTFFWLNPDYRSDLIDQINPMAPSARLINGSFIVFPKTMVDMKLDAVSKAYGMDSWDERSRQLFHDILARPVKAQRVKIGMR